MLEKFKNQFYLNESNDVTLPPLQALRTSHRRKRETRLTGDEAQWTMGRRKKRGEAPSRPFSPSRLSLSANFHRETSGYEANVTTSRQEISR